MNELASPEQLRAALLRWALFLVPLVILLGFASGQLANSGEENAWFQMLEKPAAQPPGWLFGVAWTILYAMMGFAIAIVASARSAPFRAAAVVAFIVQLALNLAWSPVFFGMHQVSLALGLILLILAAALVTTFLFGRVRALAAWLMVPYLAWLCFASILNYQFDQLNPDAETLQVSGAQQRVEAPPIQ